MPRRRRSAVTPARCRWRIWSGFSTWRMLTGGLVAGLREDHNRLGFALQVLTRHAPAFRLLPGSGA